MIPERNDAPLAQMRELLLNFERTSVMGRVGRVALRPLYDLAMRGGGKLDIRPRWALSWRIQLSPKVAARITKPIGRAVDVGICLDACAADFANILDEFAVLLKGAAEAQRVSQP